MELQNGRPASLEGREEKEIKVYDLLDRLGIEYLRTDHEAAGTIADCLEVDQVLGITICKNLFLCNRQKTEFYLLMMPGHKSCEPKNCPPRSQHPDCPLHRGRIWSST